MVRLFEVVVIPYVWDLERVKSGGVSDWVNKEVAAQRGGSGGIGEGCNTQIVIVNSDAFG